MVSVNFSKRARWSRLIFSQLVTKFLQPQARAIEDESAGKIVALVQSAKLLLRVAPAYHCSIVELKSKLLNSFELNWPYQKKSRL